MSDETYAGWATRETWSVNIHLMNDEVLQGEVEAIIRRWNEREGLHVELADALKERVEELTLGDDPARAFGLFSTELLTDALARVDWFELARTYAADFAGVAEAELERRNRARWEELGQQS